MRSLRLIHWAKIFLIFTFILPLTNVYGQDDYDLKIATSDIVTPTDSSSFCSNDAPQLTFRVYNLDSTPSGTNTAVNVAANSILATMTLTGANTGVFSTTFNTLGAGSENLPGTTIGVGNYAFFTWPTSLSIQNTGTTNLSIQIGVPSLGTDTSTLNNTATITLTTNEKPSFSLTSDRALNSFCSGESGFMTFTATPTANYYLFYKNDVQVASITSNVYTSTFASLTNGTSIKVRGYSASGCYGEETLRVYINDSEPGSISGDQTICVGDTPSLLSNVVSATVSGTFAVEGEYKWQSSSDGVSGWSDIAGATSSTFQPPAAPPPSIFYRRLVNNNGCYEASNSIEISINALPTGQITAVGLATANSLAASASICDGTTVNFNGAGGVEYEFFIDNVSVQGRSATSNFSTNTLDDTDEVKVRVYDSSTVTACFDDSAIIKFNVTPIPIVTISSNVNSNTFCSGESLIFTAGGGGSALFTFLMME